MSTINNVTRLLDSQKVAYEKFELPPEKLSALDVAHLLGVEPDSMFKTIVVTREKSTSSPMRKKPLLVVVPALSTVDLKMLATALGDKKVHLPTEREAEQLTGLQAGGISPLALINKGFQVILDSSAQKFFEIHVSGGQRGLNIRIPLNQFARLTHARFASVCTDSD